MKRKNFGLYCTLLVISTVFLGVAYAKVANINLDIVGNALLVSKENIEIKDVFYKEDLNADKDKTKVLNTAKTLMQSIVKLANDKDSFVTFSVTIKNNTSKELCYIETVRNDDFYVNSNNKLNDQITYEINGINQYDKIDKDGGEISFDIVFKYNVEDSEEIENENNILKSYLNFRFREVYNVTYIGFNNDDYIKKVIGGEKYEIELNEDDVEIEENITISGDVSSSYNDGLIVLENIKSDIVISKGVD